MKAVVLAAGEGRRLEPLTRVRPKPMLPVANRPLLSYVVEAVADAGIDEVVLVVGYERERIQQYFGDGDDWGIDVEYAIQEKQLGTGHAILQAEPRVDDAFLVLNGDRIIEAGAVEGLLETDGDGDVRMTVARTDDPRQYGVVELDGDTVTDLVEKPPPHATTSEVINAGVYAFPPSIFGAIRDTETDGGGELAITATLRRLLDREPGSVRAVRYRGTWLDVTHLWDIVGVNASVIDRGEPAVDPTASVHHRAAVADGVAMGADTRVGPNATVLGGTALGDNVSVGPNAVVANAVVLPDATIGAGSVLRDCVVGENARIGPNATVEGGRADVVVDDQLHGDVRLGGVIGDNARLGGDVTVAPGTIVGNGVAVETGTTLDAHVPSDAEVRRG